MPKPEPRPLRTLPERAFRARARLVAALLCCVCFAGLAARLSLYTDKEEKHSEN